MSDPLTQWREKGQPPFWMREDTEAIQERQLQQMILKRRAYVQACIDRESAAGNSNGSTDICSGSLPAGERR